LTDESKFTILPVVKTSVAVVSIFLVAAFWGCNKGPEGNPNSPEAAQAEAAKLFILRCATCHGATGAGNGSAAANLSPKPRNLQDKAWQASVDDAYLEKIIKLGGTGVGRSAAMPPNPDIADNELVVKALVAKVRSLAK
jgi:mono/diheme cytochrome c family protein